MYIGFWVLIKPSQVKAAPGVRVSPMILAYKPEYLKEVSEKRKQTIWKSENLVMKILMILQN